MGEKKFLFLDCTLHYGELFFEEFVDGLPAKMNLDSGEVVYFDEIEGQTPLKGERIDFIDSFENKVYALCVSGKNIMVFDFEKNQCQYIELPCSYQAWGNFAAFERYGKEYFIFPRYGNKIFVMSTDNYMITEIANYFRGISKVQCCCRAGAKVWILPEQGDIIGVYDLYEKRAEIYELEEKVENAVDAVFVKESIYILTQFGIIYHWHINRKKMKIITLLESEHTENESMGNIIYAGNKLITLPSVGKDIKILDLLTNELETYQDYPTDFFYQEVEWGKYYGYCEDEDFYYFAMRNANYCLKIRKSSGELLWMKPKILNERNKDKLVGSYTIQGYLEAGTKFFNEKVGYLYGWLKYLPINNSINCDKTDIGRTIYDEWRKE